MSQPITLPADKFAPGLEGLFDLDAEFYHDHGRAPGVSRTVLVELLDYSPLHARSLVDGSYKKKATAAMSGGSLVDMALLEPDKFKEGVSHWVVPAGMKLSTKEGIAWKKDHPNEEEGGLPRMKAETDAADEVSVVDMKAIIASVMAYKEARYIIERARKQESAFCFDPDTGLMRKVRPDARVADNRELVLADLKVTFRGGVTDEAWADQCARQMYHIQDSFYSDTYRDLLGEKPFFLFIAVERKPPYACRVFQLDPKAKEDARDRYRRALEHFKRCQDTGVWPAYKGIKVISLPGWALRSQMPERVDSNETKEMPILRK